MALLDEQDFAELQRDVQRKLGRCMFRLQQYELLIKALVGNSGLSGPIEKLQNIRAKNLATASTKTLGVLVGELKENFLKIATDDSEDGATDDDLLMRPTDQAWISYRIAINPTEEQALQHSQDLAELVKLRNELVHHFIERFDVFSHSGCLHATAYLEDAYKTIDSHCLTLRRWIIEVQNASSATAAFINSPEYYDCVVNSFSIGNDEVDWPKSAIVELLQNAEAASEIEGWILLNTAIAFIRATDPDQGPKKYNCSSWRHVIHESQMFEVRKGELSDGEGRLVWYRSKSKHTTVTGP